MRRGAQRFHMHVEFIGQDLKRHPIMQCPLRLQRPRFVDDSHWRGSSARIHVRNVSTATPRAVAHSAWDRPSRVRVSFSTEVRWAIGTTMPLVRR